MSVSTQVVIFALMARCNLFLGAIAIGGDAHHIKHVILDEQAVLGHEIFNSI